MKKEIKQPKVKVITTKDLANLMKKYDVAGSLMRKLERKAA